ncbi:hypothetical protein MUN74_04525 [Agromyces endophyticus]|uniref:hypothetical protein n=1 Tax=Agromyces sp. H17E-10 TaxID=2932244 RepID=UPI001FCFE1B2|nr:hypothetical protein [Agromyces sp. H17E-10]UOQ90188.1 hypothetical protein MUN74_04525 [Agromyces sp. H17E-10]
MPEMLDQSQAGSLASVPGATIIRRIRGMIFSALSTGIVYSFVGFASKGACFDAAVDGPEPVSTCVNLTLSPSPLVYLGIAVTVVVAISLVLRPGRTEASALRLIDRAVIIMIAATLVWAALAMVSFIALSIEPPGPGGTFTIPFTFGVVDVDITR